MARKKKNNGGGPSGEEWLQTYSDTVTLLLTFFVLLYSFSSVDAQKFKQVASAFQSVLTGQSGDTVFDFNMENGNVPIMGDTSKLASETGGKDNELYDKVNEAIKKSDFKGAVKLKNDSRGVLIELKESILFELGQADIKHQSLPILEKLNTI